MLGECYRRIVGPRRLLGAAIVVICIGTPLIESIDTWDHTLNDGNDTEANVVIVALCLGLALSAVATIVVRVLRALHAEFPSARRLHPIVTAVNPSVLAPAARGSPPPTPLRI